MGGRALKNTETRRYTREEFDTVSKELINTLKKTFDRADIPLFYREKDSFGDIDILVEVESDNYKSHGRFIREYIENTFNPNEIFHNGNAWSFDYKEVQVDLILTEPEHYDSYYIYLAYNDLGNFIGRLAQSIGVKFGQEGLWYVYYGDADNSRKHKIFLSKDYYKIYSFLGLDYQRFVRGFDTLEEIFDFVTTSNLFNPENFKLHTLNKVNRERNAKRKSYMSFLNHIEGMEPNYDYDKEYIDDVKENIVDVVSNRFPEANVKLKIAEIKYDELGDKLVKLKFNGGLIKDKYGLEGKKLGESIENFREYVNEIDYNFKRFIINFDEDYIWNSFELANGISSERIT